MLQPKLIGYLSSRDKELVVVGLCCDSLFSNGSEISVKNSLITIDRTARIFEENITPYGQSCVCCGSKLVENKPKWPELFP